MTITIEMIKELRAMIGAGVLDCKKALEQSEGDMEQAKEILRKKGLAIAAKKADREAADGRIEAYVHAGSKVASLVEVNCETDFVARTDGFEALCHDLAMQVTATAPQWVSRDDVPQDVIKEEKAKYRSQMAAEGKPERILEQIIEGKLNKFYQENCLLEQAFIKDDSTTIRDLLTEFIAQFGENIVIKRFARFQID